MAPDRTFAVGDWVEPWYPPTYHRLVGRIIRMPRDDLISVDWLQIGPGKYRRFNPAWQHPRDLRQIALAPADELIWCLTRLEES